MFFQKKKKPLDLSLQKKSASLDGVEIYVMPSAFVGRTLESPSRVKKELPKITLSKPVQKPLPPVVSKPLVSKGAKMKKKSKFTFVFSIIGGCIVLSLGIAGYFVIRSLDPQPEPVPNIAVETPDNKIQDIITSTPEVPLDPVPGIDTDSDGLTDIEEGLYGTSTRNPDTDGDTFLDGNEVFHRYSPLGIAPATLLTTGAVLEYRDDFKVFTFTYPKDWQVENIINESLEITTAVSLTTAASEKIILQIFEIGEGDTFEQWYAQNALGSTRVSDLHSTFTKAGYEEYIGTDERTAYVIFAEHVYAFVYDLGEESTIDYLQNFQMLINSFVCI